jgi:hypothetical protein
VLLLANSLIENPKLCIDCKYFIPPKDGVSIKYAKCGFFQYKPPCYWVDGEQDKLAYHYCTTARSFSLLCGETGKKFEKKNENE